MKKIRLLIVLLLVFILVGCDKNEPAKLSNIVDGESIELEVKPTDNPQEIKQVIDFIGNTKPFKNGKDKFEIIGNIVLKEDILVEKDNTKLNLNLDYLFNCDIKIQPQKYLLDGNLKLEGQTKTNSDSLILNAKNLLDVDLHNDDQFLYADGRIKLDQSDFHFKRKADITDFTSNYKLSITTALDFIKHYSLSQLFDLTELEKYFTKILATTKDTITFEISLPLKDSDSQYNNEILVGKLVYSCQSYMPICLEFNLDDALAESIKNHFVGEYEGAKITLNSNEVKMKLEFKYADIKLEELSEDAKKEYQEVGNLLPF